MKRLFVLLVSVAALSAAVVASASATNTSTITLSASKATFVESGSTKACANWGHYYVFHVGTNANSVRRGLVQFDLSSLPANAEILSATLSVYETITLRGSGVVGAHLVTTPWAEGGGSNTCVGSGATWLLTGLGPAWLQPGSDFTAPDQATVTKSAGDAPGWDRFDITPFVQGWASGAVANDGVALKLDNEAFSPCTTITNCNYWAYASNDYQDPTLRPVLTITYAS